jgi:DNA-directed RNA polymerase subunit RPC12/RpoP
MWELELGYYKCMRCGGDMVVIKCCDDDKPRLVYTITPIACPRCDPIEIAAIELAEAVCPELVDWLRRFYDP